MVNNTKHNKRTIGFFICFKYDSDWKDLLQVMKSGHEIGF